MILQFFFTNLPINLIRDVVMWAIEIICHFGILYDIGADVRFSLSLDLRIFMFTTKLLMYAIDVELLSQQK